MSNLTELQIIKAEVEDWEEASLGCYISCDNTLLDVITPINSTHDENKLKMGSQSTLKLIIKSMDDSDEYIGSISIQVSSLPAQGYVWLPLFSDISSDSLSIIPEQTSAPRVLISITTVIEESILTDNFELQQLEVQYSKLLAVHGSCKTTIELLQKEADFEKARAQENEHKYFTSKDMLDSATLQASKTEESLMALLQQKDEQISDLQEQLKESHKLKGNSEDNDFSKENSFLKEQIAHYKLTVENLQTSLDEIGKDWKRCEPAKSARKLEALKNELHCLQSKNNELSREMIEKDRVFNMVQEKHTAEMENLRTELLGRSSQEDILERHNEELKIIRERHENDLKTIQHEYSILKQQMETQVELNNELTKKNENLRQEIRELEDFMSENTLDKVIYKLGLAEELTKSYDQFYVYKESLIELHVVKDKLYVAVNTLLIPFHEFVNRENQHVIRNTGTHLLKETNNESKLEGKIKSSSSRRLLTSTLCRNHKQRINENSEKKIRLKSAERKRPFK